MGFMGDVDTKPLGSAALAGDEDAESSGSSGAEMSGGTNRSSGGYSGDYSSISDSSSGEGAEKKDEGARHRKRACHRKSAGHRKGHSERTLARNGGGGVAMMGAAEAAAKKVDSGGGPAAATDPSEDAMERLRPRDRTLQNHSDLSVHVSGRRHTVRHQEPSRDHIIHSSHRHNHKHHQAKTEEVNRRISGIMDLYNASLQAATARVSDGNRDSQTHEYRKKQGTAGIQVVATGLPISPNDPKALQLSGLPIYDPSDLRVGVQQLHQTIDQTAASEKGVGTVSSYLEAHASEGNSKQVQGSECYANLMKAYRPFFDDSYALMISPQAPMLPTHRSHNNGSDGAQSSSGFTSFFATTKSESNQTNSGSGEGSFFDPSHHKIGDTVDQTASQNITYPSREDVERSQAHPNDTNDADHSDSSSLVVLARVKRKHKEQSSQATSSSNSDNTNSSWERNCGAAAEGASKRVRIETMALEPMRRSQAGHSETQGGQIQGVQTAAKQGYSSLTSSLTQSLESSGSDSCGQLKQQAEGINVEGSSNNHSGTVWNQPMGANQKAKPRVVAEISSGATTANGSSGSGTATANGSSGSGGGSDNGNNTTSKSESGSGNGNSDQQKASGDGDTTGGSDGFGVQPSAAPTVDAKSESRTSTCAKTDKPLIDHHPHGGCHNKSETGKAAAEKFTDTDLVSNDHQEQVQAMASKEKIMEKKRKRMNMRREYEEEVQRQVRESSESRSISYDTALEPGKPITLEEVLSFTKTARLLVQAVPPFLAVHVNAAFTSLCGIQSPAAIGMPVASIITLPDPTTTKESDSSGSDNTNNKESMSSLSGSGDANSQNHSSMANANAAALQRHADVPRVQNQAIHNGAGLSIDRLIVARGYGYIHEVEVLSVPHHSHSHTIEGSEVRFVGGNDAAKHKRKDDSKILCRMSVSPVTSTASAERHHGHTDVYSSHQSSSKRYKARPNQLTSVKHYLIQLEAVHGPRLLVSRASYSSASTDTTLAAKQWGITKSEVHARRYKLEHCYVQDRMVAQQQGHGQGNWLETEGSHDENASGMGPIATCG